MSPERKREVVSYLFFGVTTTIVNIGIYQILLYTGVAYWISNLAALIAAKLYAYIVNKKFVFRSRCGSLRELLAEIIRFITSRGLTGLIDYFGLIAAVSLLGADKVLSKYVLQIIVILLNYVLGKRFVFRKPGKRDEEEGGGL